MRAAKFDPRRTNDSKRSNNSRIGGEAEAQESPEGHLRGVPNGVRVSQGAGPSIQNQTAPPAGQRTARYQPIPAEPMRREANPAYRSGVPPEPPRSDQSLYRNQRGAGDPGFLGRRSLVGSPTSDQRGAGDPGFLGRRGSGGSPSSARDGDKPNTVAVQYRSTAPLEPAPRFTQAPQPPIGRQTPSSQQELEPRFPRAPQSEPPPRYSPMPEPDVQRRYSPAPEPRPRYSQATQLEPAPRYSPAAPSAPVPPYSPAAPPAPVPPYSPMPQPEAQSRYAPAPPAEPAPRSPAQELDRHRTYSPPAQLDLQRQSAAPEPRRNAFGVQLEAQPSRYLMQAPQAEQGQAAGEASARRPQRQPTDATRRLGPPRPDRAGPLQQPTPSALFGPGLPPPENATAPSAGAFASATTPYAPPAPAAPSTFMPPPSLSPRVAPAAAPISPGVQRRAGPRYGPPAQSSKSLEIRRLRAHDLPSVPELANADLLPGQPACNRQLVDLALRGESPVDAQWWKELANVQAVVAVRDGDVVGAASYAIAPADGSGWLLWLHAREDRSVVDALADRVLGDLNACSHIYAFWIATALTLGVEALPAAQRPVTKAALEARGLVGRDTWRYMVAPLENSGLDTEEIAAVQQVSGPGEIPAWRLTVGPADQPLAVAEIALGREGCGVLWWIDVEPSQRGRGIGRTLLKQAMRFLALRGARTVAVFVDHDDPRDRDRRAAVQLFESAGFEEFDHLWAFESQLRFH